MKYRRLTISIILGCIIALSSLSIEIDSDPISGVAWRGLPVGIIKRPPFWEANRAWRLNGYGWIVCIIIWSLLSYPVIALIDIVISDKHTTNVNIRVCKKCGYNLRGLRDPRCPECGTPFDPNLLDN